jgi:predicted GNAT family acetyltransferase
MGTTVHDHPERSRFEIEVDGRRAGFADYRRADGLLAVTHTEIDPEFGGQGLGTTLVEATLQAAAAEGAGVLPQCWFVRDFIAAHAETYLALVPVGERSQFGLPGA